MEPEGPSPCSQQPATGSYTETDDSSPHLPTLFPQDPQKFPDWVDNKNIRLQQPTLVEKQHIGLWRQNSLHWLTK
jgi:hypothetical protein